MEDLIYFYQNPIQFGEILNRKKRVTSSKTIIKGAFNCGKSYFAFEWFKQFEFKSDEILYLDLNDLRANHQNIFENLYIFLQQNPKIKALCIKNLNFEIDFNFDKLNIKNILITSELKNLHIKNFSELYVNGVDFEEFIAFFNKNLEQSSLFSQFLIYGNGIKNSKFQTHQVANFLQSLIKSKFNQTQTLILIECAKQLGRNFSSFEIYKNIKNSHKISKDTTYKTIKEFENMSLICFCPHLQTEQKKLFFYDFSFKSVLNYQKDFYSTLLNALFCELNKLEMEIFYNDFLDFIIPKKELGILLIPFSQVDLIYLKFKKILINLRQLNIKTLKVITITNQKTYFLDGIKCEIIPFWQYAISL